MKAIPNEKLSVGNSRKCKRSEEVSAQCVRSHAAALGHVGNPHKPSRRHPRDSALISFKGTHMTIHCLNCLSHVMTVEYVHFQI